MNSAARIAFVLGVALAVHALLGCDPNVVVGHAGASDDTQDADVAAPLPRVTWLSGVHNGNDLPTYLAFGSWRGRDIDVAHTFLDRTQGWEGLVTPSWPVDMFGDFPGRLVMSEPLYPDAIGNNADCAKGLFDEQWKKLGSFLVARGRANTIIRLGWGFNDMEHPSRADPDPRDWIACFRRVVSAIRATDAQIQIDWSFNPLGAPNVAAGDPFLVYPGDAYVDYVGFEAFDMYPPTHDDAEWNAKCRGTTGLCRVIDFVRMHGKKLGIAEWGVTSCGGDPGGDNAYFIRKMIETFAENREVMGYEAYFEDGAGDVCSALTSAAPNPEASAMYREIYGQR